MITPGRVWRTTTNLQLDNHQHECGSPIATDRELTGDVETFWRLKIIGTGDALILVVAHVAPLHQRSVTNAAHRTLAAVTIKQFADASVVGYVDGRPIAAVGGLLDGNRTVWICELRNSTSIHSDVAVERLNGLTAAVLALAIGSLNGRSAIVAGDVCGNVLIWDVATGDLIGDPISGPTNAMRRVLVILLDGRYVLLPGDGLKPAEVREGEPVLVSSPEWFQSLAIGSVNGRAAIVFGGWDGSIRIWDMVTDAFVGDPFAGGRARVESVAIGEINGRSVIVSGGSDAAVRLWDAESGAQLGDPVSHRLPVRSVAIGRVHGRMVIASCCGESEVLIWDTAEMINSHRNGSDVVSPRVIAAAGVVSRVGLSDAGGLIAATEAEVVVLQLDPLG